jgi:uncharacterized protein with FMN-binding domain
MSRRMPRRLVALSASAVTAIYAAGLLSTHTAAENVSAAALATPVAVTATATSTLAAPPTVSLATPATVSLATPSTVAVIATPTTSRAVSATTTSVPTATATSTAAAYRDGTYSGTGTSRFGNVTVSVTTAGGKIASVQITKVTTKYPASRIASLPAQVLQAQSASVNVVTGATYSTQAFKQAVQQALTQAVA